MSNTAFEVAQPGLLTTVQDLGRRGYQRYGIPVCGALDPVSLRIANILVGNVESAAGLEVTVFGPELNFTTEATIAVTGAAFDLRLDSIPVPSWESVPVRVGTTLSFGGARDGVRGYLAISGGVDVPPVMGSRSTDLKGGFGGLDGRALQVGDVLSAAESPVAAQPSRRTLPLSISREPTFGQRFQIRVVLGPQDGLFSETGIGVLLTSEYAVSLDSDRMGYRLQGPPIEHVRGPDIVSDGSALGSIQVPGSGEPIVLLADRGTTGGYTKVATVISPDIGLLAQAMPGAAIRFTPVSVEEAHDILLDQEELIREIKASVGLELAGTFSVESDGEDVAVLDTDGRPIAASGIGGPKSRARKVSATVADEEFEFELGIRGL